MTSAAPGLLMALAASVALSTSYLLQHAGSASAAAVSARRPWTTLRSLLRSPRWSVGAAVGMAGWALHVGALSRAPLSLVQAFVAGGLALTVPLAVVLAGPPRRARGAAGDARDGGGARAAQRRGPRDRHGRGSPGRPAGGVPPRARAAGRAARSSSRPAPGAPRRSPWPAALAYGAADLVIKGLTGIGRGEGTAAALASPWLAVAVTLSVAAFFCFQRALQDGRPVAVIALMTAATNAASIAGGFVVLGDVLGRTPALAAAHALGFAVIGLAAWRLAPAQAVGLDDGH